jgi:hypothetical protein
LYCAGAQRHLLFSVGWWDFCFGLITKREQQSHRPSAGHVKISQGMSPENWSLFSLCLLCVIWGLLFVCGALFRAELVLLRLCGEVLKILRNVVLQL